MQWITMSPSPSPSHLFRGHLFRHPIFMQCWASSRSTRDLLPPASSSRTHQHRPRRVCFLLRPLGLHQASNATTPVLGRRQGLSTRSPLNSPSCLCWAVGLSLLTRLWGKARQGAGAGADKLIHAHPQLPRGACARAGACGHGPTGPPGVWEPLSPQNTGAGGRRAWEGRKGSCRCWVERSGGVGFEG